MASTALQRLAWTLMEAKEILDDLPDIGPGPSQDTLEEHLSVEELFEELIEDATKKGYTRITQQLGKGSQRSNSSPIASSQARESNPPQSPQNPEPRDDEPVDKISTLVKVFLNEQGRIPLQPAYVLELLSAQPTKIRRQEERAAVGRIFGGVQWADEEDWSLVFNELAFDQPTASHQHCQASALCDREINTNKRLHQRHQLIEQYTQSTTSERIIHTLLIKVDWIRFAEDYNSLRPHEKTAWLKEGYMRANPDIFADLDNGEKKEKLKEYDNDFKGWKRRVGKDTTCRNRLYELFIEYGAMIILDPAWNIQALRDHAGSNSHKALLRLPNHFPRLPDDNNEPHHPLSRLQPAIEHALVCIVTAIAGPNAGRYVDEFLEDFTTQMKIPRMPDYD